ncbi:MAG: ABC-F family ATP-binding cassette domain-containing protein [Clostridia bacterium]|nr:ABC-F family ATP-binding cassette domain-containing protein [Clostridia bacterium]
MTAISLSNVSLEFGTDVILDKVSFSLNEGDKLGIVGVNGAGKSTLFKIIRGEYSPTDGSVFISKDKSVGMLEQNTGLEGENTVLGEMLASFSGLISDEARLEELQKQLEKTPADAVLISSYTSLADRFKRSGGYEFRSRCKGILKNLGFDERFHDLKISGLSGGQKTRLALARLLITSPDILMLDEPTNHLDVETLAWLEDFLSGYKGTLLVISHDRFFLDKVTNKTLEIENTHAELYNGNYSRYVTLKAENREIRERQYKNQQKEIARIEAYIEQQRRWNRERNIIAAESRQKALDRMVKIDRPEDLPEKIRLSFTKSGESGNDVLTVKKLAKAFPNKPLFSDVSFLVKKRDHLFIAGPNGCGKSTLIKIIADKLVQDAGSFEYGYNVTVGYYDQENQNLDPENTVLDELWNCYEGLTQTEIRSALALFLFKGDDIEKKVSVLSGGEKARLTLCKLILSKMNLLILDEPTNHLDINSREALENALLEFDGTIIAVSHDRYFISKLATRVLDLGSKPALDFIGNYEEYKAHRARLTAAETESAPAVVTDAKEQYLKAKEQASEQRRLRTRMKKNAEETEKLEAELEELMEKLADESIQADYVKVNELYTRQTEVEERLMELYEEAQGFEEN